MDRRSNSGNAVDSVIYIFFVSDNDNNLIQNVGEKYRGEVIVDHISIPLRNINTLR